MMPPAPALLSMMTGCPSRSASLGLTCRPRMSCPEPAENGRTQRTNLEGHVSCACTSAACMSANPNPMATSALTLDMLPPPASRNTSTALRLEYVARQSQQRSGEGAAHVPQHQDAFQFRA